MSGSPVETDPLAAPRDALSLGDWDGALDLLSHSGEHARSAAGLELRAHAAYGAGHLEEAVSAWEDLHSLQQALGENVAAARAAAMVAMYLMMDTGLMTPVRGWLRRAERLLVGHGETPVHAVVAMVRTYERLMCGDMDAAADNSRLAIELGTRQGVQPAVVIGRVAAARLRIFEGDIDAGLEMLDDIAVTLMSGEVDSLTTGMAMCELICAMQGLAMYDRAGEWTRAMEHWRQGTAFGGINGRCRVHRAEMLRLTGPCDRAEAEALKACEELRPWMRREFGWPLAELGNIRLRRGDLSGAEEAFLAAHENAWTPQPGLALLRLAQGDSPTASTLIAQALDHPFDTPSKERPPFGGLRRAPLLDAQVEIAAGVGDTATARNAADELREIADGFPSQALGAAAYLAQARVALMEGDPKRAVEESERAIAAWTDVGAPFEAAAARMVLGEALHQTGYDAVAAMEWQAAQAAFEEFGAVLWAERARVAADGGLADHSAESLPASMGIFSCDGDTRTACYDGVTVRLHDLKGLRYLARLLAEPGREFHVLDLIAVERGSLPTAPSALSAGLPTSDGGHAGELLDQTARDAYRRRLAEVDEDIEEATRMNDIGRLALAEIDREYLVKELTRAVGLGGRHRHAGDTAERARTSVTRSLRYGITRLGKHHPALGRHLARAVRTGAYCAYDPDPRVRVSWSV